MKEMILKEVIMKRVVLIVMLISVALNLLGTEPAKFLGYWQPEDGKAIYEIFFQDNLYHVKTVWVAEDAKERQKNSLDKTFIQDLEYSPAKGELIAGRMNIEKRKIKCNIEREKAGNLKVTLKAGIMKRSISWIPAKYESSDVKN